MVPLIIGTKESSFSRELYRRNSFCALVRPIFARSASLMETLSNQPAASAMPSKGSRRDSECDLRQL